MKSERTEDEPNLFTEEELKNMLQQMKSRQAPGLDGIPMEAFKILEEIASKTILDPLNSVLSGKQFPKK
ncbi:hypothetical protein JTB14_010978 [Gonioctena quinquepunctata]|nr:hypothetical protein JTB14_010978 [Gonioctena quinquepunctata]